MLYIFETLWWKEKTIALNESIKIGLATFISFVHLFEIDYPRQYKEKKNTLNDIQNECQSFSMSQKNYLDFIEVVQLSDYEAWTAILQKFSTIKKTTATDKILNAT